MNPINTPRPASGGELSNVTLTGPVSDAACPHKPSARQNGSGYTA
jgi:hypothetical protein